MRNRAPFQPFLLTLCLLALGALCFRLYEPGNRAFHGDEAVHAFKFLDLWQKGEYKYDPNEYHGPTLYYAALPSVWLHHRHTFAETREADYRLPIIVFGAAMLLWLLPLADGLGKKAALLVGVLTAISPAFVFYSRYFIQEIPLAFFTLGMIACGWRYTRNRKTGWLVGAGVCAGLMIASKETAVLAFASAAAACGLMVWWTKRVDKRSLDLRALWQPKPIVFALAACLIVACLFLSGWGTNLRGPFDYLRAYTPWLNRAGGTSLHKHGFFYYLHLLVWTHQPDGPVWSEGLIVGLALVGLIAALLPARNNFLEGSPVFARFAAFYTLILTLIYSLIPYKTPWCVLSFLNGMILLAGIGAITLLRLVPGRIGKAVLAFLLLLATVQLGFQSYRTSYVEQDNPRNPYCYAQPAPDVAKLGEYIEKITRPYPQGDQTVIQIIWINNYYWPMPWYLRRFPNIGYYNQVPPDAVAPIILASQEFDEQLTQKLDKTHLMNKLFNLRSDTFVEVWPSLDLWSAYLKHKKETEKPEPDE